MKKTIQIIALACLILAILSVVLAIFTAKTPTANTLTQPKDNNEMASLEEATQSNEVQLLSAPEDTGAYFTGVSISPLQTQFTITGKVYDISTDSPLAGLDVQFYCNGAKVFDGFMTDDKGSFSITGSYGDCTLGSHVALKVNYNNQEYETGLNIPDVVFMSTSGSNSNSISGSNSDSINSFSQKIPGVPEFPLATMGLAILGVGLGLALLRKQ
jgi:hypothetical protein